jgi:hypothetical protein
MMPLLWCLLSRLGWMRARLGTLSGLRITNRKSPVWLVDNFLVHRERTHLVSIDLGGG